MSKSYTISVLAYIRIKAESREEAGARAIQQIESVAAESELIGITETRNE